MRLKAVALVAAMVAMAPRATLAQVGTLDERTLYVVVKGSGRGPTHGPLLAIVLWRGERGWMNYSDAVDRARTDSTFRNAGRRADDADLAFFGSGKAYGIVDRQYHQLTVEGMELPLAPSDSALVVMVTVPSDQRPRTVATARIGSTLPPEYWPKTWYHGDTTFMVHPAFDRLEAMLLEALRRSPTVADILR